MSENIWADLRKPFAPEEIGKLPRVTCGDCSNRNKECSTHSKSKCNICGAWVSEKHIHIDYVGHADVTSRLLAADPQWNWEPKAEDEHGMPAFDMDAQGNPVGLWIKLTVGGVTRLGYGSVPSGQPDAVKVLIGDALRNAAMRFGVALDLWAKGDRADPTAENATASAGRAARSGRSAGDVFEKATPAQPRQGGNGAPRGQVARPAQAPIAVPDNTEPDQDAQQYADEAHGATTISEVEEIHQKAREAGKIGAFIRSPSTGKTGKLAVYIDWKRKQVKDIEAAWLELNDAAGKHRTSITDLENEFKIKTGVDMEAATAPQIRDFIASLSKAAA
jgi:hypothetical protein